MCERYPGRFAGVASVDIMYPRRAVDELRRCVEEYGFVVVEYMRAGGWQKVLFGSNHPFWPAASCLEDIDVLDLDELGRTAFLAGNARRVFGLDATERPFVPQGEGWSPIGFG